MAKEESTSSSVSTNSSIDDENYYQLLEAFKETHKEAYRLTLLSIQYKSKNNWMENRVKILEEELNNSKSYFENLEMVYQNSFCKCDSTSCENCESLQKKVHYLMKNVDKLSKGKSNFETVFGKSGLGFNPQSKNQ